MKKLEYVTVDPWRFDAGKFEKSARRLNYEEDESHLKFVVAQMVIYTFSHVHAHDTAFEILERKERLEKLDCAGEIDMKYFPREWKMSGVSDSLWLARRLSPFDSQAYLHSILAPLLREHFKIEGDRTG